MRHLLSRLLDRSSLGSGRRPMRCRFARPVLEALEDRTLLATLTIDPKNLVISATAPGPMPQYNLANPASGGSFGSQVVPLSSGNIVVSDPTVNSNAGAVYLFNGATSALISTLAGNAGDQVGSGGVPPWSTATSL